MTKAREKQGLTMVLLVLSCGRVLAEGPHIVTTLAGPHIRHQSLIGNVGKQRFLDTMSRLLADQSTTLGSLKSFGTNDDYVFAGPGPIADHCGYRSWRTLFDTYHPKHSGCVAVQDAVKIGSAIIYRSVDDHCQRNSVLIQGKSNPLELQVAGHRVEILDVRFYRAMGKENEHRIGAEFFVRASGTPTVNLAKAVTRRLASITRSNRVSVELRSDLWFFDFCGWPAVFPFEEPKVPSKTEFRASSYATCSLFVTSPIECFASSSVIDNGP